VIDAFGGGVVAMVVDALNHSGRGKALSVHLYTTVDRWSGQGGDL
jgi:hypothetical protein